MTITRALVVGAGAIGLRTAKELCNRGVKVAIRSAFPPLHPSTCSMGAGGLWMPFHCDDPRVDRWAIETLDEIHPMTQIENSGVELMPAVVLMKGHKGPVVEDFIADDYEDGRGGQSPLPVWSSDKRLRFQHMTTEMLAWQNSVFKLRIPPLRVMEEAGYKFAWYFNTPIVNSPEMLKTLLVDVENHENFLEVNHNVFYKSLASIVSDAKALGCDAVVNCSGLGSSELLQDKELVGARGILLQFDRSSASRIFTKGLGSDGEEVELTKDACIMSEDTPWGSDTHPFYIIPRGDILVVGGTYLEGDTRAEISDAERATLLQKAALAGIDTSTSSPVAEWVGFRPYRPTTRCELEPSLIDGVKVAHCYGHGGSGWTLFVGAANEVSNLLLDS